MQHQSHWTSVCIHSAVFNLSTSSHQSLAMEHSFTRILRPFISLTAQLQILWLGISSNHDRGWRTIVNLLVSGTLKNNEYLLAYIIVFNRLEYPVKESIISTHACHSACALHHAYSFTLPQQSIGFYRIIICQVSPPFPRVHVNTMPMH